jgi:hypothetical protein
MEAASSNDPSTSTNPSSIWACGFSASDSPFMSRRGFGCDSIVYSSIDGSGNAYPIGECDNASRVIKYVMLLGYRHSHYNLVDMRIHDINVEADLNRHNPNAPNPDDPVDSDGTATGYKPASAAISFVDMLVDMATANTLSWWTGWWPLLHTRTTGILASGAFYIYQTAVDLLSEFILEVLDLDTPNDDDLSESEITMLAMQSHENFLWDVFFLEIEGTLIGIASILMIAIDILLASLTKCPTLVQLGILATLLGLYFAAMLKGLCATWDGILTGRRSASSAFNIFFFAAACLVGTGVLASYSYFSIFGKDWSMRGTNWGARAKWFIIFSIFIVLIKALLLGIVLGLMIRCWELWLQGY